MPTWCTTRRIGLGLLLLSGFSLVSLTGCNKPKPPPPPPPPPQVEYVTPVIQTVTEFEEFSGRTWSPETVEIRARVTGYLQKVRFKDGADVAKGEVLFEIDDRTYKAEVERTKALIEQARTQYQDRQARLDRMRSLVADRSITQEEYDTLAFETAQMKALIASAEASRDLAQLNLEFTKVRSPLAGRIGRKLVDEGNIVKEDDTLLATVVSLDPIYAYFDFDERTVLKMRRQAESVQSADAAADDTKAILDNVFMKPIEAGLSGDAGFPLEGRINWVDNQVDVGTGTLRARAEIANAKQLLSPGMFIRLRVPVAPAAPMLLVPEEALGSNQGLRFVYVVTDAGEISERRVEIGWLEGSRRVIRSGLTESDKVVVTGLQRIRPKMKVDAAELGTRKVEPPPQKEEPAKKH